MAATRAATAMDSRLLELLLLAQTLLVGRVALALLPPGRLGGHHPTELAATASASLLLGFTLTLVAELPAVLLGLPTPPTGALALLALLVAIARWSTLPGAFVPAPFPSVDPAPARALAWRFAAAAAILAGLARAASALWPMQGWSALLLVQHLPLLALPALLDHALRQLDLEAWPRTWVWFVPAALVWVLPAATVLHAGLPWVTFLLGGGTALLLVWRRNADRRALAVSALAFGAATCSAPAAWPLGLAGLVWLVLATPGGTRAQALRWAAVSAALLVPVAATQRNRFLARSPDPADLPQTLQPPGAVALLLAAALPLGLIALTMWWARRPGGAARP